MGHVAGHAKDPGISNVINIAGGDFRYGQPRCFSRPVVIVCVHAAIYAHINRMAVTLILLMAGNAEIAHSRDVDIVLVQWPPYAINGNLTATDILPEVAVIMVVMIVVTIQALMCLVAEKVERACGQVDVAVQGIGRVQA